MADVGEILFSRVLMPAFLSGEGSPGGWDLRIPDRVTNDLREGIRGYLKGKSAHLPVVDTRWAFTLPTEIPDDAFSSVERLPEDAVIGFTLTAQRALAYLQSLIPRRQLSGLATRDASMTEGERAKLRRAAAAIEDPIGVLAAPDALSVDHISAVRAVYPSLYADVTLMVGEEIQNLKRPLRQREESAFSRILGIPARALTVLQGSDKTQPDKTALPKGHIGRGPPAKVPELETLAQKIASQP